MPLSAREKAEGKEEQAKRWSDAAKLMSKISMCAPDEEHFANGYPSCGEHEGVSSRMSHAFDTVQGPGGGAKMRTKFGSLRFPIPFHSETNYSVPQPSESLWCLHHALGLDKGTPDLGSVGGGLGHYEEAIKIKGVGEQPAYLYVPGFAFPTQGSPYYRRIEEGFQHWFAEDLVGRDAQVAHISGRVYLKAPTMNKDESERARRYELVTALLEIGAYMREIEGVRTELRELAATVHEELSKHLASFKMEAEDDEEGEEEHESKKQKVVDKADEDQEVHVNTIAVRLGGGIENSLRTKEFKGNLAASVLEVLYAFMFEVNRSRSSFAARLPKVRAPCYSDGMELRKPNAFRDTHAFVDPDGDAASNTIMTQKIRNLGDEVWDPFQSNYLKVHDLAHKVSDMQMHLIQLLHTKLAMSLVFEGTDGGPVGEWEFDSMNLVQKVALFNVFMSNIWQPSQAAKEEGDDESGSESASSEHDEDDDYENEGSDDEESDDEESGDEESDDAYEEEGGEEGSGSGSGSGSESNEE